MCLSKSNRIFIIMTFFLLFSSTMIHATSTLIFSSTDYEIQVVVSDSSPEGIVTVNFGGPDQKSPIVLMPKDFSRIKIDCERQKLLLVFQNPGNKEFPPSFRVCARKDNAYIKIGGKKIILQSDWIR